MNLLRWIAVGWALMGCVALAEEAPQADAKTLEDLNQALSRTRMVPRLENGKVTGYQVIDENPTADCPQRLEMKNGESLTMPQGSAPGASDAGTE